MKAIEKLLKFISFICRMTNELSIPDKVIVIIVAAFLSAVIAIVTGTFHCSTFFFGLVMFAIFLFWPTIKAIVKSIPKTPEGKSGFGFAIGMIGLVILLIAMILNR